MRRTSHQLVVLVSGRQRPQRLKHFSQQSTRIQDGQFCRRSSLHGVAVPSNTKPFQQFGQVSLMTQTQQIGSSCSQRLISSLGTLPSPPSMTLASSSHSLTATSTTTTASAAGAGNAEKVSSTNPSTTQQQQQQSPPSSGSGTNWILDHLGHIFLGAIGLVVASLVRSSYGTSNRNKVRDGIETMSVLDPMELEDLRQANRITPQVFRYILRHVIEQQQQQQHVGENLGTEASPTTAMMTCTYLEFVQAVKVAMISYSTLLQDGTAATTTLGDDATTMIPTIEMGHLMDRVVVGALQQQQQQRRLQDKQLQTLSLPPQDSSLQQPPTTTTATTETNNIVPLDTNERRPLTFWFTVLSLALDSSVSERIRILYDILSYSTMFDEHQSDNSTTTTSSRQALLVPWTQVCNMVGYLQLTCQLPPDTQVLVTTNDRYPFQQYHRGTPFELTPIPLAPTETKNSNTNAKPPPTTTSTTTTTNNNGNQEDIPSIDLPAFAEILRSRSVCAWGECYHKTKPSGV